MSISALIGALRGEGVAEAAIPRVLATAMSVDEATARAHVEGRSSANVSDPSALHALLLEAQQRGDWGEVVSILLRLSELEDDVLRRAQYLYTAAITQRVNLKDPAAAIETLDTALDCDPSLTRAFDRQCAILSESRDWKSLERAHRKMIRRVHPQTGPVVFELWHALAQIYRDRLNDRQCAIAAYQMAAQLRPDDEAVRAALQELEGAAD